MTDKADIQARCIHQQADHIRELIRTFVAEEGDLWPLDLGYREILIHALQQVDELESDPDPEELARLHAAFEDDSGLSVHAQRKERFDEVVVQVADLVDHMAKEHGEQWPSVRRNRVMLGQYLDRVDRFEEALDAAAGESVEHVVELEPD